MNPLRTFITAPFFVAILAVLAPVRDNSAAAVVVFDNMSIFESGDTNAQIAVTGSTPNYFMGDGYLLIPGTTSITGFDIFPANLSGTDFTGLKADIYVWQDVNLGTVNSTTPAFSTLLAHYSAAATGSFPSGYYFPFEGSPVGSSPGFTLGAPLAISGTNIGISFNYQGTSDGVNYVNLDGFTSLISYGTNASVGGEDFNGYYRNVNSETDGNFTSGRRSLGLTFQTIGVRVFGTTSGNIPPVANAQSVSVLTNSSVNVTLTATDPDGDPLTYTVVDYPTNGVLSGAAPYLVYTPNTDYVGPDAFTFVANDGITDSVPALILLNVGVSAGLIINPVYDDTILNDPNAAAIMNTIQAAIQTFEARYSDHVTVTIQFTEMNSGVGQSLTYYGTIPYSSYYTALVADSKTTNDTVVLAHVTGGGSNPVNGGANISVTMPNLRALGFTANPPGGTDSTISVNMSLMNITRPPGDPNKFDLQAVVSHEIDEVLGSSSGVGGATISPVDLFRYTSAGARTFTTSGDDAYFSINGGTALLARYNQNASGDYGDWWSTSTPSPVRVQDAFATPGAAPDLGVELIVLDSIGWDLVSAIPSPAPVFGRTTVSGTTITLKWSSIVSRSYQVQYKTNLTQASWNDLGSSITASATTTTATDTIVPNSRRFYRVALLPAAKAAATGKMAQVVSGPIDLRRHVTNPGPGRKAQAIELVSPQRRPIQIAPSADRVTDN